MIIQKELSKGSQFNMLQQNINPILITDTKITPAIINCKQVFFKLDTLNYLAWRKINQVILNKKPLTVFYNNELIRINSYFDLNCSVLPQAYEESKIEYSIYKQAIEASQSLRFYLKDTNRLDIPEDLDYVLDNYAFRYDIQVPPAYMPKEKLYSFYEGGYHRAHSYDIGTHLLERLKVYDSIMFYLSINEPFDVYEDEDEEENTSQRIKYYGNMDLLDAVINYVNDCTSKGHHIKSFEMEVNINGYE